MMKSERLLSALLIIGFCSQFASGYPGFQDNIPNGKNVPDPCQPGHAWNGVGHENREGGGARNRFGVDFFENNMQWTKELCEKDSDSDGKTNGEELGDPDCVWVKGSIPAVTDLDLLSHPGVCEPITSPGCQEVNGFLAKHGCEALGLTTPSTDVWCPAIKEDGVESITYTFENYALNDEETNYLCRYLDIPSDEEYELIAVCFFFSSRHNYYFYKYFLPFSGSQ